MPEYGIMVRKNNVLEKLSKIRNAILVDTRQTNTSTSVYSVKYNIDITEYMQYVNENSHTIINIRATRFRFHRNGSWYDLPVNDKGFYTHVGRTSYTTMPNRSAKIDIPNRRIIVELNRGAPPGSTKTPDSYSAVTSVYLII